MWESITKRFFRKANIEFGNDIVINDSSAFKDIVMKGSLGFGESYMHKKWDSPRLDVLIAKLIGAGINENRLLGTLTHARIWLRSMIFNLQNRKFAPDLAEAHYNAGNHLFKSFLDPNMIYTCAYFKNTNDLEQAQINKIAVVGKKLDLQSGDKVLDIGCGWGGTARIISEMFDVEVTGVSDSTEMVRYAREHNSNGKTNFIYADYRDIMGQYDKIYNIGFLEAVGPKNYRSFMEQVNNLLLDNGIFLTHTIIGKYSSVKGDPWLDKYIFPHGVLPSKKQIEKAASGLFAVRDVETFGHYYETTLEHWSSNLNDKWDKIKDRFKNPEVFKRMMDFYLLSCKAGFHAKMIDLAQYIFTKTGQVKKYSIYRF
jgi:cyclopropane-fatty-acyl-phospholipid synthase